MITAHNDNFRTPEEHRAAVEVWRRSAPATDGKIFGRAAKPKSPKHAVLAEKFRSLLKWIALWEAAESDPVQSSWMAAAHMVLDRDEDDEAEPIAPSNEGAEEDWLPRSKTAAERLLAKMLAGVEIEDRPESIVRTASDGTLEVVETRTRRVVVGGDVEISPFSKRLVRAGDVKFNDGPSFNYVSAANDNFDDEDDEAGLVAVDRFTPTPDDLRPDDDDLPDEESDDDDAVSDYYWDERVRAGSIRGFRHTFETGNQIVVPLRTKLRFTVAQTRDAKDALAFALKRLGPETVALLNEYRAETFEKIGETLGKFGKTAERHGQDAMRSACAELAAVLVEHEEISAREISEEDREAA
ncbi:hypothetical protein [Bosea sp. (in: a-proteobacteria)]|uniref:hypothetical protein n=1 Tax=Bosea sp. (in: a-proteobacteria) TaxID=1871050 RepID=UPI003F72E4CB